MCGTAASCRDPPRQSVRRAQVYASEGSAVGREQPRGGRVAGSSVTDDSSNWRCWTTRLGVVRETDVEQEASRSQSTLCWPRKGVRDGGSPLARRAER
jgi:hypothetical protein